MEKAKQLADQISRFVNGAGKTEVKEVAGIMANDHPTLQQNTMKLAVTFIQNMARKSYTDARNQDSKEMAIAMINGYQRFLADKFMAQGMNEQDALKQAHACIQDIAGNLPLI